MNFGDAFGSAAFILVVSRSLRCRKWMFVFQILCFYCRGHESTQSGFEHLDPLICSSCQRSSVSAASKADSRDQLLNLCPATIPVNIGSRTVRCWPCVCPEIAIRQKQCMRRRDLHSQPSPPLANVAWKASESVSHRRAF